MAENSEIYDLLLKVKNGYDPGWAYFSRYDELLDNIRFNEKNPGLSTVVIVFSDLDDYFKLFDEHLNEDDVHYIMRYLTNQHYNDFDTYQLRELWETGDIFHYLNDENKELIDKISYFISKDSIKMGFNKKAELLYKEFEGEIDNIMGEWSDIEHECRMDAVRDELYDEFSNKFYTMGIKESSRLYKYTTSVNVLLRLFDMLKFQDKDIFDVLKKIIDNSNEYYGSDYYENYWNVSCSDFDTEGFNRNASWYLNKIYDSVFDNDIYIDAEEYYSIKEFIGKEYGFDKWNKINTKENLFFKVDDIDPKTNKIIISFRNNDSDNREEKRSVTYDELKRMQTQYELFNEIRKIRNKIFLI